MIKNFWNWSRFHEFAEKIPAKIFERHTIGYLCAGASDQVVFADFHSPSEVPEFFEEGNAMFPKDLPDNDGGIPVHTPPLLCEPDKEEDSNDTD